MARRKASGAGLQRETESLQTLKTPFLHKTPVDNKEDRENRENTSPEEIKKPGNRRWGTGYRHKLDQYRKVSYFLRHEQADTIIREAEIRGQEISEFFRSIVEFYYEHHPLDEERVRQLMQARMEQEIRELNVN